MELILVRHSITQGNVERRFIGLTDQPLTPEGEALALRRAAYIPPVEHVFVSPLLRCRRTAELLWPHADKTVLADLRETDFGPFEGKIGSELEQDPAFQAWMMGECGGELSTAEPRVACAERAGRVMQDIIRRSVECRYRVAGVVSHGGTIMSLLSSYGRPARSFHDWLTPNCGGWRLRVEQEDPLVLWVDAPLKPM